MLWCYLKKLFLSYVVLTFLWCLINHKHSSSFNFVLLLPSIFTLLSCSTVWLYYNSLIPKQRNREQYPKCWIQYVKCSMTNGCISMGFIVFGHEFGLGWDYFSLVEQFKTIQWNVSCALKKRHFWSENTWSNWRYPRSSRSSSFFRPKMHQPFLVKEHAGVIRFAVVDHSGFYDCTKMDGRNRGNDTPLVKSDTSPRSSTTNLMTLPHYYAISLPFVTTCVSKHGICPVSCHWLPIISYHIIYRAVTGPHAGIAEASRRVKKSIILRHYYQ